MRILFLLIVVLFCGCEGNISIRKYNGNIGIEKTTGYIIGPDSTKRWKVSEVEYEGSTYLILYPLNSHTSVIMTKK